MQLIKATVTATLGLSVLAATIVWQSDSGNVVPPLHGIAGGPTADVGQLPKTDTKSTPEDRLAGKAAVSVDAGGRPAGSGGSRPSAEGAVQRRLRTRDGSVALGTRYGDRSVEPGAWVKPKGESDWRFLPLKVDLPFADVQGAATNVQFVGGGTIGSSMLVVGQAALAFDPEAWLGEDLGSLMPADGPASFSLELGGEDTQDSRFLVDSDEGGDARTFEATVEDIGLDRAFVRELTSAGHPVAWLGDGVGGFEPILDLSEQTGLRVIEDVKFRRGQAVIAGKDEAGRSLTVTSRDGRNWVRTES